MRVIAHDRYGGPDVLHLEHVEVPTPGPRQVLVEVLATSVNLSDWEGLVGSPAYARLGGIRRPSRRVLGSDIAGRVAAIGPQVTAFRVGDEVYGDNLGLKGGFAEFAVAPESVLAHKPAPLGFVEASTIPQPGAIALQGTAGAGPGTRVVVNGGGGGTGMFAIQVAKLAGAHVTGVDNAAKLEHMRALGADEVLDHRREDFARHGPFDLVLDLVATRSVLECRRALAPGGRYRCVGGPVPTVLSVLTIGAVVGLLSRRHIGVLAVRPGPAHFGPLAERCATGEISIRVERTFSLEEVPAALAHVGAGLALGRVVVVP